MMLRVAGPGFVVGVCFDDGDEAPSTRSGFDRFVGKTATEVIDLCTRGGFTWEPLETEPKETVT
jgi:hypothetical protein